jgi:PAS domain S-box-containing protein
MKKKTDTKSQNHSHTNTRAEEALHATEEKFELAFKHSPIGICISSLKDGRYVEINDVYCTFLGYSREELIGRTSSDINLWVDMAERDALVRELIEKGNVVGFELRFRDRHGKIHWGYVSAALVTIKEEPYLLTQTQDITEKKNVEGDFEKKEAIYRILEDNITDVIFTIDMNFKYTYASPSAYNLVGYPADELVTMRVDQLVEKETLNWFAEMFVEELDIEKRPDRDLKRSRVLEYQHVRKDGSKVWVETKLSFLRDKNNTAEGMVGTVRDITKRKLAEETLRQSEERYRSILDDINEGYFEIDLKGNFTLVNNSTCRDMGYSREELIGMNNRQYTDKEDAKKLFQVFNEIYRTGQPVKNFQWQIIRKDGIKEYTEGSISLMKDSSGKIIGFRGIAHDITGSKLAEEKIRQSEAKYRLLADHMKDQVWIMDLDLKTTYISPSVEKLLGYSLDDLKEIPLHKLLTSESFEQAMDFFAEEMPKAMAAPPDYVLKRPLEMEFICKDGHRVWGESRFSFIRNENGKPLSLLGEGRDITERRKMEDALRKSEENFRHSLDESPLGVRISTTEGKTVYANRAILDIYGYDSVEELANTPLQKRYTPESFAEYQIRKEKRLRGEFGPSEYEISIIRKNGEIRHLYVFRKEIDWNGKKQSQVIYQDITLRRQTEDKLNETLESLRQSIKVTINVLGMASEAKDPYMAGHQKRVADLARAIATEMKLPHDKIEAIRMASAIHDIGKISVPAEILCKPAILSDLEFSLVKGHPQYGYDIIKDVESPWPLADIVHQHHERLNGSGYPLGLKEKDILIESRVLAVADVVEAMISYRPYRPALGLQIALTEIENNAGTLYDRKAVEACLKLFREKKFKLT